VENAISYQVNVAIIGAGIVGLATGLELTQRFPGISLAVIEKESVIAGHQSSHNSGVIHSGIYYKPGSLKAKLCVEGGETLQRFCQENAVPFDICGKLIVATAESELPQLNELYRRGNNNGLKGLRMLTASEIREFEPYATGIRGIHVPSTGIVDYAKVAEKYAELIANRGGAIHLSHEVTALIRSCGSTVVETTRGPIQTKLVINCAGLQSDRISRMANAKLDLTIIPFRGEYYEIVPAKHHYLNVFEYARFPGFWTMTAKHWRMSLGEYHRSWSKAAFVRALQRLMPELAREDLVPGASGVRAQALNIDGKLIDDFHFVYTDGMVHVCNVPSPAATASLAIGKYIVDTVVQHYGANPGALN
jgi:L-2-hydroxyglutarate oxidase